MTEPLQAVDKTDVVRMSNDQIAYSLGYIDMLVQLKVLPLVENKEQYQSGQDHAIEHVTRGDINPCDVDLLKQVKFLLESKAFPLREWSGSNLTPQTLAAVQAYWKQYWADKRKQ